MNLDTVHNIIIIGSGPAGYACALYSSRDMLNPLLFTGSYENNLMPGGQLTTTSIVENYLGFKRIDGSSLIDTMKEHAEEYPMTSLDKSVKSLDLSSFPYQVIDYDGNKYKTKSIVIATGATAKKLDLPSGDKFWHKNYSLCFVCDGALPIYRNKIIAIIGGGDTAFEGAQYMSKYGSKIYLIHRNDNFKAKKIMIDRVKNNPKIEIITNTVVIDAHGEKYLDRIEVKNVLSGEKSFLEIGGLFGCIGHIVNTDFIKDSGIELDNDGYIVTVGKTSRTNIKNVYGAGDCADRIYKQALTAAADGVKSALDANHDLSE
jgi:thioredoxin reductase (NADPH)